MEGCTEVKVSALACDTCGALSERPQARCKGHSVAVVTVTKRFFRCAAAARLRLRWHASVSAAPRPHSHCVEAGHNCLQVRGLWGPHDHTEQAHAGLGLRPLQGQPLGGLQHVRQALGAPPTPSPPQPPAPQHCSLAPRPVCPLLLRVPVSRAPVAVSQAARAVVSAGGHAMQDVAAEMEAELFGYADASRLQVRGPEQKWVLS